MDLKVNVCRLCGTADGIKFKIFDAVDNYISKIHQLLPIMIHEQDPWPKLICHRCAFKLQDFIDFRELCIQTDLKLKRSSSLPVPKKQWEEQRSPGSWLQIAPSNSNPSPALHTQVAVGDIKQEKPDESTPSLSSQKSILQPPTIQQSHTIQQSQIMHHSPQLMQRQPYQSLLQQQPQISPVMQHQQQQFISRMPILSQALQQPQHMLLQTQSLTSPSPQLRQISPMAMVQFRQGSTKMSNNMLQNVIPGRTDVNSVRQRKSSRSNVTFLDSNERYFLEEPDEDSNEGNINVKGGSHQKKNEKTSTAHQGKNANSKKRKKSGGDSSYKKKRSYKSKSKAKSGSKPKTSSRPPTNVNKTQSMLPNTRKKPGPKSMTSGVPQNRVNTIQNINKSKMVDPQSMDSNQSTTSFKEESSDKKSSVIKTRKPGPKSKVGNIEDDSEVSFLLYKPPNHILDNIDITDDPDTPNASEDEGDPLEGIPSHVLLTKIPGICNIYTCTICECTITSKRHVLDHSCKNEPSQNESKSELLLESNENEINTSEAVDSASGPYICEICNTVFSRQVTLVAHREKHLYNMTDEDSNSLDNMNASKTVKKKNMNPIPEENNEILLFLNE
ncbi:hypothetical protein C0J52_08078 [Blattella germanica]|nr:hypothetical protein C0J52_08078 [Blattella germanica]